MLNAAFDAQVNEKKHTSIGCKKVWQYVDPSGVWCCLIICVHINLYDVVDVVTLSVYLRDCGVQMK